MFQVLFAISISVVVLLLAIMFVMQQVSALGMQVLSIFN
jgi:hypothetical protein